MFKLQDTLQHGLFNLRKHMEYSFQKDMKINNFQKFCDQVLSAESLTDYVHLQFFIIHYAISEREQAEYLKSQLVYNYFSPLNDFSTYGTYIMYVELDESLLQAVSPIDFSCYWNSLIESKSSESEELHSSYLTTIAWLESFNKDSSNVNLFLETLRNILLDESLLVRRICPLRMAFLLK